MKKLSGIISTLAVLLISSQIVFAQCYINGQEIPCKEFFATYGWIFGLVGTFLLVLVIFWIRMLIDCIKRKFDDKIVWILVLIFTGFLGAILYYFLVKRKRR